MISESDEELWSRVRLHDEDALHALLRRYYVRLGDYAYPVLRRRDLAEEAVSNVFLTIWRRRESLVIKATVRSYLFAAVGNQALSLRRSHLAPGTVAIEDVSPSELADHHRTDSDLLYRELQAEIETLLATMPPRRQLIFRMNRLEGLRYAEIAAILRVSESTVQNHMVQAAKQLEAGLPRLRLALERNSTAAPFA